MEEKDLKNAINNISNVDGGIDFLKFLLENSGCFEIGSSSTTDYSRGKKDYGLFISELLQEHSMNTYIEILKKRRIKP